MKSVPYLFLAFLGVVGLLVGCGGPEPAKETYRAVPISTVASGPAHERPIVADPVAAIATAARAQIGKTVRYDPAYVGLVYPGGDVPIERGVCTDVVIRALRDALKMDLQKLVHEDMRSSFSAYPAIWGLKRPDRNIDHRRVPNLRRYFERQGYQLDVTARQEDYLPGDVVTCTVGGNRPHIMIVSDRTAANGTPLVIHNIGSGAKEENRLFAFPVTGHYRMAHARPPLGEPPQPSAGAATSRDHRTVRVYVALADNKTQGIVPVSATLGNGDDPGNNLYWGALYGVKAFLKRSSDWQVTRTVEKPADGIMERCVLRHTASGTVLTADAYRGARIRQAVTDFLRAASGSGETDLVVYVGHNGLMDFRIDAAAIPSRGKGAEVIILACKSKPYFMPWLERLGASPVLLTTGLMAPEAYTLEAALDGWIKREAGGAIRERAAAAYHKYQNCGMSGARRLFYSH